MRCESSTRSSISASSRSLSALLAAATLLFAATTRAAELARPQRVASYTLHARLDAVQHRVEARGTVELFNFTSVPLTELYLHLYMNAFKNDESLFLRSPFGAGRSGGRGGVWGYVDVKRLYARESESELWPARSATTPGDPHDETNVRVPLLVPLEPGKSLTLEVEFEVALPGIVERTGYVGDYHFVAQWFPKLARLMPDGSFAHFAFHPRAEFAANFGSYDVTLDVPAGDVVGASGACTPAPSTPGRRALRCVLDDAHDFAWTSWPAFKERHERIGGVEVRVLTPPGHGQNAELELETVRFGLRYFGERFGAYPYPTLTVVHPPEAASNSGGMEYPTLITTGGPWYAALSGARAIETVTLHELGHQWFYGLLASDERRFPFLDEGVTSFVEQSALSARFGTSSAFGGFGLSVQSEALGRTISAARGRDEPVAQAAADFSSFRSLGAIVYSRTATVLATLSRVYGEPRMQLALADYARRGRFAHPEPHDLLDAVRGRLGDDAARNLERALYERGSVDYLVREVRSAPADPRAGVFDESSGRRTVARSRTRPPTRYAGYAVVFRHGALELPVDVELRFGSGRSERRRWDGAGTRYVVSYDGPEELVGVTVDPERKVLLDDDLTNNAAAVDPAGVPRVLERLIYWCQLLLAGGLP